MKPTRCVRYARLVRLCLALALAGITGGIYVHRPLGGAIAKAKCAGAAAAERESSSPR